MSVNYTCQDGTKPKTWPAKVYQPVTATISCEETIEAKEGSTLEYTFPIPTKKGTKVTAAYVDLAGNEGTAEFICPCDVVDSDDKTAPGYLLSVKTEKGGSASEIGVYTEKSENITAAAAAALENARADQVSFAFTPEDDYDDDMVKVFVTEHDATAPGYNSTQAAIDGVAVAASETDENGKKTWTVTASKPVSLDVYLIDEAGNKTVISGLEVPDTAIVDTPPTGTLSLKAGETEVKAYTVGESGLAASITGELKKTKTASVGFAFTVTDDRGADNVKLFVTAKDAQAPGYSSEQAVIEGVDVSGHTATVTKAGSYDFYLIDRAGNTASVKGVEVPRYCFEDVDAPSYTLSLLRKNQSALNEIKAYDSGAEGIAASIQTELGKIKTRQVVLQFVPQDDSGDDKVKLFVVEKDAAKPAYSDTQAAMDGVTVSGMQVTVDKAMTLDCYLLDEAGNTTALTGVAIPEACFAPASAPQAVFTQEQKASSDERGQYYKVWMYTETDDALIFTDASVTKGTFETGDKSYSNAYCVAVRDYAGHLYQYQDIYGNIGTVTVKLSEDTVIDNAKPVVNALEWNGTPDRTAPTADTPVKNLDISALIKASKTLKAAELYKDAECATAYTEAVPAVSVSGSTVTVLYTENVGTEIYVKLTAASNDATAVTKLPAVNCIDKTAPKITAGEGSAAGIVSAVSADKSGVTLTFRTDEPAVVKENALTENGAPKYGTSHELFFTRRDVTEIHLVDAAGNISDAISIEEHVNKLDLEELSLQFSADGTAWKDDPGEMKWKPGSAMYLKPSKAAALSLDDGAVKSVKKGETASLSIPDQRLSTVKAVDENTGKEYFYSFTVEETDRIAPVLVFRDRSLSLDSAEELTAEKLSSFVKADLTVTDNEDTITAEAVTVTGLPELAGSTVQNGIYRLEYTVKDKAGNQGYATRMLYVMEGGSLQISVNGETVMTGCAVVSKGTKLSLEYGNVPEGSKALVRIQKGVRTSAQMKYGTFAGYSPAQLDLTEFGGTAGIYTLYVRDQNRREVLVYISVQ